jgi:hypothetical protein
MVFICSVYKEQCRIWNRKGEGLMKGRFLISSFNKSIVERNIYADKSSLVVEWILLNGVENKEFSLREVALATSIGLGSVHRVFESLVLKGYLQTTGIRTSKKFFIKNPEELLLDWIERYSLVNKCKMFAYSTGFQNREQVMDALMHSGLTQKVVLALHSSAEAHGCKNTNLQQLELYLMQANIRPNLEKLLKLSPKERGYDVLLIEPYYKAMLGQSIIQQKDDSRKQISYAPALLTFLDLYHFPLRGIEQAEFMAQRILELKRIYKKGRQND